MIWSSACYSVLKFQISLVFADIYVVMEKYMYQLYWISQLFDMYLPSLLPTLVKSGRKFHISENKKWQFIYDILICFNWQHSLDMFNNLELIGWEWYYCLKSTFRDIYKWVRIIIGEYKKVVHEKISTGLSFTISRLND